MQNDSAIVFSGIVPHPPIMVPEVGGDAAISVQASIAAMGELTRRIIESGAETVVLISPHAPLDASAFVAYGSPKLSGDFANFRAPNTRVEFVIDEEVLDAITEIAAAENYEVLDLENYQLDHGSAVPLYFLDRNGWRGRVVALGYSFLSDEDHLKFGNCIRLAADEIGRPVAFVASGDLSHRLKPEAPAGYSPAAYRFDNEVVEAINSGSPEEIIAIDQDLRRIAGECGYRSMLVALGVTQELPHACEVLSYEAPFGVGYLVAQLTNISAANASVAANNDEPTVATNEDFDPAIEFPALARLAIETFVHTGEKIAVPEKAAPLLSVRAACFVSIKTHTDDLRGCIGTVEPTKENLAEEVIANAINAASRDPRFDPVSPGELHGLRYSVDILAEPEPATFADLDPKTYGVIVSDEADTRRGLLLPDIPGVETAEQQLEIATRKAGIPVGKPVKLLRFRVDRYRE